MKILFAYVLQKFDNQKYFLHNDCNMEMSRDPKTRIPRHTGALSGQAANQGSDRHTALWEVHAV
jgi:hypothetical protein